MKLWKKSKPPLNVQGHSSGNRIMLTSWLCALAETVEQSRHKNSTRFNTHGDEGELPKKRLKLFLGEK